MAENDNDRTGVYDSSENDKTGFYVADAGATAAYAPASDGAPVSRTKRHGIGVGDKISLRGEDYTVTGIISEGTGEAVIYKIESEAQKAFALKLYFEFGNSREEPNEETLRRIKEITDPDILKLHDFGVGADKYLERYCYEICDYAAGGDLLSVEDFRAKYTPEFIEKTIVPEIFKGIRRLHDAKIYHCDLKPQNVFFLDEQRTDVIIGDYGSAKAYELESLNTARRSTVVKGTEAYIAPEQAIGIISESNDYYSFGIILLHLLYPETLAADAELKTIDRRKINLLKERQYNSQTIVEFKPEHERLNNLIAGLTLHIHKNRFGQKEIEQWLQGKMPEVKYESGSILPIKLGRATIRTDRELIAFIESNQDSWYRDLIVDAYDTLKNWLDSYRDIPTRITFDKMVQFYKSYDPAFVKEAIIRFFQPDRPVAAEFDFFDIYKSKDVEKDTAKFIAKIDEIWKHSDRNGNEHLKRLSFYLFQLEFALRQRGEPLNGIYDALGVSAKSFDDFQTEIQDRLLKSGEDSAYSSLVDMFYAFDAKRTFRDLNNQPVSTLEELGLFYAGEETYFSNKLLTIEKEKFLAKLGRENLGRLRYKDFIFEIFKDKAENRLDLIGLSFNSDRIYKIKYTFYKSLDNFLAANGITKNFISRSGSYKIHEIRRGFFQSFSDVGEKFIDEVSEKHNISKLSDENLAEIREKFRRDSRDRYAYLYARHILPRPLSGSPGIEALRSSEELSRKRLHWKGALVVSLVSVLITLSVFAYLAYSSGWIPKQSARYVTFNKPVKLDGASFAAGDYLEIASEGEFANCLQGGAEAKCYPTEFAVSILNRQGATGIDLLGKLADELSQPRDVFKLTKNARLGGRSYQSGSVVNLTSSSNDQFCFDIPGKDKCYVRRNACRGNGCNDTIDEYGYSISNYRGKRLFTFNQNTTLEGLSVKNGTVWEVTRESLWGDCFKTPTGEKCYLTQYAIKRFRQPDVPVLANFGTIGAREMSITRAGFGGAGFLALLIAGLLFFGVSRLAKQIRLFVLRNEINTVEFKN